MGRPSTFPHPNLHSMFSKRLSAALAAGLSPSMPHGPYEASTCSETGELGTTWAMRLRLSITGQAEQMPADRRPARSKAAESELPPMGLKVGPAPAWAGSLAGGACCSLTSDLGWGEGVMARERRHHRTDQPAQVNAYPPLLLLGGPKAGVPYRQWVHCWITHVCSCQEDRSTITVSTGANLRYTKCENHGPSADVHMGSKGTRGIS